MKKSIDTIIGGAVKNLDNNLYYLRNIPTDCLTKDEHQSLTDAMASLTDAIDILISMRRD